MELAVLAAGSTPWADRPAAPGRGPAHEAAVQLFGVDARDDGLHAGVDHLPGESEVSRPHRGRAERCRYPRVDLTYARTSPEEVAESDGSTAWRGHRRLLGHRRRYWSSLQGSGSGTFRRADRRRGLGRRAPHHARRAWTRGGGAVTVVSSVTSMWAADEVPERDEASLPLLQASQVLRRRPAGRSCAAATARRLAPRCFAVDALRSLDSPYAQSSHGKALPGRHGHSAPPRDAALRARRGRRRCRRPHLRLQGRGDLLAALVRSSSPRAVTTGRRS